jgi:AraC-like DNA-binding protein
MTAPPRPLASSALVADDATIAVDSARDHPARRAAKRLDHGHARIVARAQAYIAANLAEPIAIDALAAAACTTRRTLHRAFVQVLGVSPRDHVMRLRLQRIRSDLEAAAGDACTVADIANRWGIGELGRFAARYRALFGELPSATLARARTPHSDIGTKCMTDCHELHRRVLGDRALIHCRSSRAAHPRTARSTARGRRRFSQSRPPGAVVK